MTIVQIKLLKGNSKVPTYTTEGSAGFDLRASMAKPIVLKSMETFLIPTGIAIYIEDKSKAALIIPRSGLGHKHGIVLGHLVGLIDSDYQGEIFISCWNRSKNTYTINPCDRIAQLVIIPVVHTSFKVVDTFSISGRGSKGFGSTGVI